MILEKRKPNPGSFKKGHISANKGIQLPVTTRKKISAAQLKRYDKIGRKSKEEKLRYGREYQRKNLRILENLPT